jgi:hypothetical protein
MQSALDRLRDYLLPRTLEHAVRNSAFYAEHLGDAWQQVQRVADLPRLPVLEKRTAVAHQVAMRCGEAPLDFGSTSSGTTRVGSELLRVERVPEEAIALEDFREMARQAREEPAGEGAPDDGPPPQSEAPLPPLVLHLITPNHGLPATLPAHNEMRLAWSYSENVYQMVAEALRSSYGGRRITIMRASVSIMKQLTAWLLERGEEPRALGVEIVGTNAAIVTSRWRALIARHWGARVLDNYSLSEFATPATECEHCGWYHFAEPPVVAEVIDPSTGASLERGTGHLLLTGLYPYVQRQPLIRYATGDLVELGPYCEHMDARSLRFRGRRHQSAFRAVEGGTEYLLFPAELVDVVDDYPEVARKEHPSEVTTRIPSSTVGEPKVRLVFDEESARLRVDVGVRFVPALFGERTQRLEVELRERLIARHPSLARALASSSVDLEVRLEHAGDDDEGEWFVKYLM